MKEKLKILAEMQVDKELENCSFSFFVHNVHEEDIPLEFYEEEKSLKGEIRTYKTKGDSCFNGTIFVARD